MDENILTLYNAILEGDADSTEVAVQIALDAGLEPGRILNEGMIAAMSEVGKRFEEGEYYVPEMLIAAHAMQAGLAILKPHLQKSDVKSAGKIVIGTVKGDMHDIGKNLVSMMLEGVGFEVEDLGVDVTPEKFIEAVSAGGATNCCAFGIANHDDAKYEKHHYSHTTSRITLQSKDHCRRCTRYSGVC